MDTYSSLHRLQIQSLLTVIDTSPAIILMFSSSNATCSRSTKPRCSSCAANNKRWLYPVSKRCYSLINCWRSRKTMLESPDITAIREQLGQQTAKFAQEMRKFQQMFNEQRSVLRDADIAQFEDVLRLANSVNEKSEQLKATGFKF